MVVYTPAEISKTVAAKISAAILKFIACKVSTNSKSKDSTLDFFIKTNTTASARFFLLLEIAFQINPHPLSIKP